MSVHPHERGERLRILPRIVAPFGSSPRAWGTALADESQSSSARFIPTSVGNGWARRVDSPAIPVHPHERGERHALRVIYERHDGSSPRAWGTVFLPLRRSLGNRFIPTSVGNGYHSVFVAAYAAVHPHERGERGFADDRRTAKGGSSPRAWGTGFYHEYRHQVTRFIPTSVGNGGEQAAAARTGPVHPHERGERDAWPPASAIIAGSSPRAWGTVSGLEVCASVWRFIPTSVGNGSRATERTSHSAVHPHERGERLPLLFKLVKVPGSSPRAWGTD